MPTTTTEWLGNHVRLQDIEATELTLVEWSRPRHGSWRGAYVLDPAELRHVRLVVERLARLRDVTATVDDRTTDGRGGPDDAARYVRADLAGSPLHLESLLEDLLER